MQLKSFFLAASVCLIAASSVDAQQLFRRSQYLANPYLSNPAVAGTSVNSPISMMYRNQWAGFTGAPTTTAISGHTSLPNKFGIGGIIFSDNTGGAIKQTGVELTGSYQIDLNNYDAVSFGLSLMANQWAFDNSILEVWDVEDPALQAGLEASLNIDAHFGMMVFGENYAFGFAVPQLIQSNIGVESSSHVNATGVNRLARHYRFMGHYRYDINDDFSLQPSALVRLTESTPPQLDLYIKGSYAQMAWLALGIRANDAVMLGAGMDYRTFGFSYSYDITNTTARYFSPHTHEITVTYAIPRRGGFSSQSMNNRRILARSRIAK